MTELEKNTQIDAELSRINFYFSRMKENERAMVQPLIDNAAFMRVVLDELQENIKQNGAVEAYQNGANQKGIKQSAALQAYNAMIKNYAGVVKTLAGLVPPPPAPTPQERYAAWKKELEDKLDFERMKMEDEEDGEEDE